MYFSIKNKWQTEQQRIGFKSVSPKRQSLNICAAVTEYFISKKEKWIPNKSA